MHLAAQARSTCAVLRAGWQRDAARLSRADLGCFPDRVLRQTRAAAEDFDAAVLAWFDEVAVRAGLVGLELPPAPPVPAYLALPRRSSLEDGLSAVVGAGFGLGASLTVGRYLAELGATATTLTGCAGTGLALTWWVVRTRRVLSARAALERWVGEVAAGLRTALEERVLTAELTLLTGGGGTGDFGRSIPGRGGPALRNTPD